MLIKNNIEKLNEIKNLLRELPSDFILSPREIISNATIGQHFRHILEFYICLEKGMKHNLVCYDERERNVLIETDIDYAISRIDKTIAFLNTIEHDRPIELKANYSISASDPINIPSSIYRELAYALDHTVHHLAIVKIALSEIKQDSDIPENLGVAPSTVRYRGNIEGQ